MLIWMNAKNMRSNVIKNANPKSGKRELVPIGSLIDIRGHQW